MSENRKPGCCPKGLWRKRWKLSGRRMHSTMWVGFVTFLTMYRKWNCSVVRPEHSSPPLPRPFKNTTPFDRLLVLPSCPFFSPRTLLALLQIHFPAEIIRALYSVNAGLVQEGRANLCHSVLGGRGSLGTPPLAAEFPPSHHSTIASPPTGFCLFVSAAAPTSLLYFNHDVVSVCTSIKVPARIVHGPDRVPSLPSTTPSSLPVIARPAAPALRAPNSRTCALTVALPEPWGAHRSHFHSRRPSWAHAVGVTCFFKPVRWCCSGRLQLALLESKLLILS